MWEGLFISALAALVIMLLLEPFSRAAADRRTRTRLAEIDRKLAAIVEHLGVEVTAPDLPDVAELLREGKRIQAIKLYRERTGASLKDAKDACDELARKHGLL